MPHTDVDELARILKVLSARVRVQIMQLLNDRSLCVNALAARLDVTQGAVSQHLRVMREGGLVIGEKRGYYVHYRLNERTLAEWQEELDALLTPSRDRGREHPEKLRGKPEDSSPEQIENRDGDVKQHPLVEPTEEE